MELLREKFDASPHKSNASPWKIRYFSVQIKSFFVENLMFLSTNRKFPRAKFDASPYKSKAIESFSVENYTVKLGDLGSPPPANKSLKIMSRGGEVVLLERHSFSRFEMESSCLHCGEHFQENAKFCHNCGKKLSHALGLKIFLQICRFIFT